MKFRNEKICFDEVPAEVIAETYGTPVYVYEENRMRENFRRAYRAFKKQYDNFGMFYAVKAANNPALVRVFAQEGAGVDAASINEIHLARDVGLSGENVMFSGNFLSDNDIREGLDSGVIFNLDDITLLPRLLSYGTPSLLSFRVNPGYGRSNVGEYVTNAGPEAKFGVHPDQVMEAYEQAKKGGVQRFGAHMMPGSCITDPEYFAFVTELLMDLVGNAGRELGINFEFIDLGGGLGIPYDPDEEHLDIEKTAERVAEVFEAKLKEYKLEPPKLMMEPARYFIGDAGFVLGRVHAVKESYRRIVGTDVGMNVLARPAMYGSYHHVYVDGRENEERCGMGLCGQICENTDFWAKERPLPENTSEGDLVVATNAGAYGYSMSYQYNGRLRPAEVLVNGQEHCLIRQGETYADMVRHTVVPEWLQA